MKFVFAFAVCGLAFFAGCDSEPRITSPKVNPSKAAELAIAAYDADSDGQINKDEAKKSALDPKAGWDANNDGKIDQDEIQTRLERYVAMNPGLQINVTCRVLHKKRPLVGAEVVFEPEAFLEGSVCSATGTTDEEGIAEMVAEELEDPTVPGLHTALYLVRITHPDKDLPAKYNTDTELSVEFSPLDMSTKSPVFNLR